jgi:hypothetical protein
MQRPDDGLYADVARELGMTEGAVVVAAHRLRGRYRICCAARLPKPLLIQSLSMKKSNIY